MVRAGLCSSPHKPLFGAISFCLPLMPRFSIFVNFKALSAAVSMDNC